MIYFGRRYSVTLRQTVVRQVRCEKCDTAYHYPVVRTAVGTGRSAYMLDNAGAQARAKASAQAKLQAAIANGVEVVPCPSCGWLQQNMVRALRQRQYTWTFPVGLATAITAGFIAVVLALWALHASALMFIPAAVLLLIAGAGVGLIFLGQSWREKFDPNAQSGAGTRPVPALAVAAGPPIAAIATPPRPAALQVPQPPALPGSIFPAPLPDRKFGPAEIATIGSISLILLFVAALGAASVYHLATAVSHPVAPATVATITSGPTRTARLSSVTPSATPPQKSMPVMPPRTYLPTATLPTPTPIAPTFKTVQTPLVGGHGGGAYRRLSGVGDPVLGFRYEIGAWDHHSIIHRLEPLYSATDANNDPERPHANRHPRVLMAREGYVVGGLLVDGENYANAIRVIFIRASGKTPNPADTYMSDWLGDPIDDHPTQLAGKGERVIGVCGRKGLNFDALGLILAQ